MTPRARRPLRAVFLGSVLGLTVGSSPVFCAASECLDWSLAEMELGMTVREVEIPYGKAKRSKNGLIVDGLGKSWHRVSTKSSRGRVHYLLSEDNGRESPIVTIMTRWDYDSGTAPPLPHRPGPRLDGSLV